MPQQAESRSCSCKRLLFIRMVESDPRLCTRCSDLAPWRAGPALLRESLSIAFAAGTTVRCPPGQARITNATGRLRAAFVVHAVGPYFPAAAFTPGPDAAAAEALLASAYRAAFDLAAAAAARSIGLPATCDRAVPAALALSDSPRSSLRRRDPPAAFPAISCGVRRCPHSVGAAVALREADAAARELHAKGGGPELVEFVLGDVVAWETWTAVARSMGLVT